MKRYHVTTFGCQMNEHDSERMKGMLESLGYSEAPARGEADLILFNTCSIREKADDRFVAHLGEAKRVKRERPEVVVGVGGCWAQSVKEEVFARFPFVDVAFGPGQVHKLAEFLTSDSLTAQGFFEFEGFTGHLPRAERHVDEREHLEHLVLQRLRPAAPHADDDVLAAALERGGVAEVRDEALVGLLADRARVEEDEVGLVALPGRRVAEPLEHALQALGVVLVHLAAEGRDVEPPHRAGKGRRRAHLA